MVRKGERTLDKQRSLKTSGGKTERITVRIPEEQLHGVEDLVESGVYPNRSEAIRESVRDLLRRQTENEDETGTPIGAD